MLDFLRKHQRYFFLVITVVIIISFSFFGTYSTLGSNTWREQIAFKAVNGHDVPRFDVDEMALFLATDNDDKTFFAGAWGPNFLNDGVIKKDFLETGLALQIVQSYREQLEEDYEKRLAKEKKYVRYVNSQAPFLSVSNVWGHFAPDMNRQYDQLVQANDGLDAEPFQARVGLFLGERQRMTPQMLRQVLAFQQRQYNWLKPDPILEQRDLSLFGYHTLEDWFGPHFNRLIAEFIINAAIIAEQKGYDVTQSEVIADLIRNTQHSFQQNQNNPRLGVATADEYFTHQLSLLNIDKVRAIKIWRQVLLFRRLFQDAGSMALIDTLSSQRLHQFANEGVDISLYQLSPSLQLSHYDDLKNFEAYLNSVARVDKKNILALPKEYLSIEEISKISPELVQKRYHLEITQVNEKNLQSRVGLRLLWNWEVEDPHWQLLIEQFPDLGLQSALTRDRRFLVLDELDTVTRTKLDGFSKKMIVREHPEWINEALNMATPQKIVVGLRMGGNASPLSGLDRVESRLALMKALDHAAIGALPATGSPLYSYTPDQQNHYRIKVLDRAHGPQVLTFEEANGDGTLNGVLSKILEEYYLTERQKDPDFYKGENGKWKNFVSIRENIENKYFAKLISALESVEQKIPSEEKKGSTKDALAGLRFYAYMNEIKLQVTENLSAVDQFIQRPREENSLNVNQALNDQWKIEHKEVVVSRQRGIEGVNFDDLRGFSNQQWSSLIPIPDGNILFYQVKGEGVNTDGFVAMTEQIKENQKTLGNEAQRHLMNKVLRDLKEKNAISLAYLKMNYNDESSRENSNDMIREDI